MGDFKNLCYATHPSLNDLCVGVQISRHKCESTSRRFQPGEYPSRGLLLDCENWWIVCSSSKHSGPIIESGASAARKLIELG